MSKLSINIAGLTFKNPVMTASGTFGYAHEFSDFMDLSKIGGVFVKGTTLHERQGNAYPRMAETPAGMLNAVGLQNKGVDYFASEIYPLVKDYDTHIMVNVSGSTVEDYVECAQRLMALEKIPAIELNISCPNVKEGGMAFGTTVKSAEAVVKAVRKVWLRPLIVKLSPNVTDITEIARAVETQGADAVSVINTLLGMAIDIQTQRPKLSTITGGLSGPCIKPVALRLVWQTYKAINIPIIGLGGISSWEDAIEFILAGATGIQIGTYNFIDPTISVKVVEGIERYLDEHCIDSIQDLIGALKV